MGEVVTANPQIDERWVVVREAKSRDRALPRLLARVTAAQLCLQPPT